MIDSLTQLTRIVGGVLELSVGCAALALAVIGLIALAVAVFHN